MSVADISVFAVRTGYQPKEASCTFPLLSRISSRLNICVSIARRRMEKLGRFFGKNPALDAQVNMAVDKFRQRVEVQLTGDGINIAASEVSEDMYASIDPRS